MIGSHPSAKSKILSHLKKLAPFSVVEKGISWASQDMVGDFSSANHTISGTVREDETTTHSVSLNVISAQEVDASCTCCTREELSEQWCPHAVALLWRAAELDFFEPRGGFGERESTFRVNSSSPTEIAQALREIQALGTNSSHGDASASAAAAQLVTPEVTIVLDLNSDRLGMKVLFDEQEQEPTIFDGFRSTSTRALDNLLLQILEDEGTWDEGSRLWFINSSKGIELILGLIQEYDSVLEIDNLQPIRLSREPLGASLKVTWKPSGLDLTMHWLTPAHDGGREIERSREVFGTGPFWTIVNTTIYRLSPQAARIASIFGSNHSLSISRAQVAPILEVLSDLETSPTSCIEVSNPELQPAVEVKEPTPILHLERRDTASDHFTSHRSIEISAALDFEYPAPPATSNVVFLRNKQLESEALSLLSSIGFSSTSETRRYSITGDSALDFVHETHTKLAAPWKMIGLEAVKKGLRFSDLKIAVSLSGADAKKDMDVLEDASFGGAGKAIDWFDCHVSVVQNNANLPLSSVFKNARGDNDRWTRLDSGAYARIPGGSMAQLRTILGMVDPNCRVSNTIKTRLSLAQAISLGRINDAGFSISLDRKLAALNAKLSSFSEIKPVKAPKGFQGKLRHYQEDGISWLSFLHEFELGGILADEMGLGKTVQALAFFQSLKNKRGKKAKKPVLIVAPTSVITNWSYEIKKFTPDMTTVMLHGPGRKALFEQVPDADIVLTSYALLRVDRYELERYEFSHIVLDEAQNIKNPHAATTKAAKSIRARHRLALTGTPTENRPMELWSIMDFLMPGYLGSQEFFRANIERPILEGGTSVQVAQMLNAKTRPFILRRLKADVEKELPPKIESVLHVEMTPSQRQMYSQILNEVRPKVFDAIKKKGISGASVSILAALLRLRQVCNHPNSIEAFEDLEGYESGKFNLLKDLTIEALESGRKILLFSQFRGMLGIIRSWLEETQVKHLYLDGTTRNRQELIDQFTQDESVRLFLISLKAGGAGLNLMAADTVIIYDPWWNPAVESQAVDRAHRIGQSKTVSVYRLVTEDSVEQKIMALKDKKSKIVDALVNENGLSTLKLAKADLESLFSPLPEIGE
jgi:superfamily II DNA or RNA helicase